MDVDPEALMPLVRDQPTIWDRTHITYKNKRHKSIAWTEVFKGVNPEFEKMTTEEKNRYGYGVMKKWTNLKDNWIKYDKKVYQNQLRVGGKKIRKYVFYDQMIFLRKVVDYRRNDPENSYYHSQNPVVSSSPVTSHSKIPNNQTPKLKTSNLVRSGRFVPTKERIAKESGPSEIEKKFEKYMSKIERDERSRSMNFFRGIAETVDKFSDENMIDFQFQVISVIRNIQQRSQQGFQEETPSADHKKPRHSRSSTAVAGPGFCDPLIATIDFEQPSDSEPESNPSRPESQMSFEIVKEELLSDS